MLRIETIAFDGDDTLWHSEDVFWSVEQRFQQLLEKHVPAQTVSDRLYATEMRNLSRLGYGAKSFVLSLIETAIEISDGTITAADIEVILGFLREIHEHPLRLIEGARETVETLARDYTLALITKGDLFDQENKIARSGLADCFDHIRIVSEKDHLAYARVLKAWNILPESFVMVGNSLRSDILPVIAGGSHAIHIPYPLIWRHESVAAIPEESPLFRCTQHITDVPEIVAEINQRSTRT